MAPSRSLGHRGDCSCRAPRCGEANGGKYALGVVDPGRREHPAEPGTQRAPRTADKCGLRERRAQQHDPQVGVAAHRRPAWLRCCRESSRPAKDRVCRASPQSNVRSSQVLRLHPVSGRGEAHVARLGGLELLDAGPPDRIGDGVGRGRRRLPSHSSFPDSLTAMDSRFRGNDGGGTMNGCRECDASGERDVIPRKRESIARYQTLRNPEARVSQPPPPKERASSSPSSLPARNVRPLPIAVTATCAGLKSMGSIWKKS